jgi:SAM-dependent methyltransferase
VIERAMDVAGVVPGARFVDLGSGDGRVVRAAAARGADAWGVEASWLLVAVSRLLARRHRSSARFVRGNLYKADVSEAEVVFVYATYARLADRFVYEVWPRMAPGALLVSADFAVAGLAGTEPVDRSTGTPIYSYRRPLQTGTPSP